MGAQSAAIDYIFARDPQVRHPQIWIPRGAAARVRAPVSGYRAEAVACRVIARLATPFLIVLLRFGSGCGPFLFF